jgi:inorganic pyrophosphatase
MMKNVGMAWSDDSATLATAKAAGGRLDWPEELDVVIEVPRGSFIKRKDDGRVDFVAPAPCPFNYGSVPNTRSGDGDRVDAVVLGPRLQLGARLTVPVVARVCFQDAGEDDPKYICSRRPLSLLERLFVVGFFATYARAKTFLNLARGKRGLTQYRGLQLRPPVDR